MLFQLVKTLKNLVALLEWTIVGGLVFNLFSHINVWVVEIGVFLYYKMYTSLLSSSMEVYFKMEEKEYFSISSSVTKMIISFYWTLFYGIGEDKYLAERALKFAQLDHLHAASPADVLVIAFRKDENVSLLAAQKTEFFIILFRLLHSINAILL